LAKRAYVLETGRIVLAGDDLRSNKKVREAYFGELSSELEQPLPDQTRSSQ
jgi:ABC-type lipopolysaccharide export system ATPase subunit